MSGVGAALSYGTGVPRAQLAAMVVGGGGGERLGGVSKPDLVLGGVRLIDRVCAALGEVAGAGVVAVVPPTVRVPVGVGRTLEDPPGGGPLAGIDAGLAALSVGADTWVVVVSVDCPGIAEVLRGLLRDPAGPGCDGRIMRGGDPEPFDQYLMGVYRAGAAPGYRRGRGAARERARHGVRRVLRALTLERVDVSADVCRDVDTPEDLAWWGSYFD